MPHVIKVDWQASSAPLANDGWLTLWIHGVQTANPSAGSGQALAGTALILESNGDLDITSARFWQSGYGVISGMIDEPEKMES